MDPNTLLSDDSSESDSDMPLSEIHRFRKESDILRQQIHVMRNRRRLTSSPSLPVNTPLGFCDVMETSSRENNQDITKELITGELRDTGEQLNCVAMTESELSQEHAEPFADEVASTSHNAYNRSSKSITVTFDSGDSDSSISDFDDSVNDPSYDVTKDPDVIENKKRKLASRLTKPPIDLNKNDTGNSSSTMDPIIEARPSSPQVAIAVETESGYCKRRCDPKSWKRNVRKALNDQEVEHIDSTGKTKPQKNPSPIDCSRCTFKCSEKISEEQREALNKEYWLLKDYKRKMDFIISNVDSKETERIRVSEENRTRKRSNSKAYYFMQSGSRHRVCQKFFKSTLRISQGPIDTAIRYKGEGGTFVGSDRRGAGEAWNKTLEHNKQAVRDHINSFPCIESHYTRKSTKRKYLDSNLTIKMMFDLFTEKYKANAEEVPVTEKVYRNIFCEEFNLSFFKPKKDICASCYRFNQLKPADKEQIATEHEAHLKRYKDSMVAKQWDKEKCNVDDSFMSASFDLQSVLQLPSSNVSLTYYSRKLCAYNLTVWEGRKPNREFCYCWPEIEGKRGSNEIASCICQWLQQLPPNVEEVSLFSDTCSGQNRNQQMATMMLLMVQDKRNNLKCITHNFLESGHSMMEVDSMHAVVENEKKYIKTFTMSDWQSIFVSSRRKNPYQVNVLDHSDFIDFKAAADKLDDKQKDR